MTLETGFEMTSLQSRNLPLAGVSAPEPVTVAASPRKTGAWLIAVMALLVLGCGTLTPPWASAPAAAGPQHLLESSASASRFGPEPG